MAHYVFTANALDDTEIVGVAVDTDEATALRISDNLTHDRGVQVYATEVEAYAPRPIAEGDIVSGAVATALPRGSAIVRELNALGHAVRAPSALLKTPGGYATGGGGEPREVGQADRYRVLYIGRPIEKGPK